MKFGSLVDMTAGCGCLGSFEDALSYNSLLCLSISSCSLFSNSSNCLSSASNRPSTWLYLEDATTKLTTRYRTLQINFFHLKV